MRVTGVDVIYDELTKRFWVLELNDCPGIDIHHYPVLGRPRGVAGDIVDFLFKERLKG